MLGKQETRSSDVQLHWSASWTRIFWLDHCATTAGVHVQEQRRVNLHLFLILIFHLREQKFPDLTAVFKTCQPLCLHSCVVYMFCETEVYCSLHSSIVYIPDRCAAHACQAYLREKKLISSFRPIVNGFCFFFQVFMFFNCVWWVQFCLFVCFGKGIHTQPHLLCFTSLELALSKQGMSFDEQEVQETQLVHGCNARTKINSRCLLHSSFSSPKNHNTRKPKKDDTYHFRHPGNADLFILIKAN